MTEEEKHLVETIIKLSEAAKFYTEEAVTASKLIQEKLEVLTKLWSCYGYIR